MRLCLLHEIGFIKCPSAAAEIEVKSVLFAFCFTSAPLNAGTPPRRTFTGAADRRLQVWSAVRTDQPPVSDELTLLCQLILKRFFFCIVSGTLFFGKTKRKCGGHSTRQSRVSRSNCYILQNQNIPSLICPAISIIFKIIRIPHTAFSPHVSFLSVTTRMQKNTKRRLIIKDIHSCLFTICRINRPIIAAHNMIFTIQIPVGFLNFNFISWSFLSKATMLECSRFSHEISFRPTAAAVGHPRSR